MVHIVHPSIGQQPAKQRQVNPAGPRTDRVYIYTGGRSVIKLERGLQYRGYSVVNLVTNPEERKNKIRSKSEATVS
jgi:hypothetical protein